MSDATSDRNERLKATMRDKASTNLNTSGIGGQVVRSPSQDFVSNKVKAELNPSRKDAAPEMPKQNLWEGHPPIPIEHL